MNDSPIVETVKASIPYGTVIAWFGGIELQQWVLAATLIYTILLIAEKLRKWFKKD